MNWPRKVYVLSQLVLFVLLAPLWMILGLYSHIRIAVKKIVGKKPSILWAPIPIINTSYNRLADRLAGYTSDCLVYSPFQITQTGLFDYNLSGLNRIPLVRGLIPLLTFCWAIVKYDFFHFFYSGGFFFQNPYLKCIEFPVLRLMGKRIVLMAYGKDVRQETITRALGKYHAYLDMTHEQIIAEGYDPDPVAKRRIAWMMYWANDSWSMGDMTEYTPGSRNDVFYWPLDTQTIVPHYPEINVKTVKIVHAPNHRHYKGTRFLIAAVEELQNEGLPVELILVEKMPNDQAQKIYAEADIVAEQFIIGWHGFFAVEAMALGKPVMCYIRKPEYLPKWADCPIVNTNPDNLVAQLRTLVSNSRLRHELGVRGRKYVEAVYSLPAAAKRFDQVYQTIW